MPNGEVLHGHDARGQQLELLLNLEAVPSRRQLQAVMEHCGVRVRLKCPAPGAWLSVGGEG